MLLCIDVGAFADVVTLKNGDRVTGTLVTVKGGNLDFKSDSAGELTIPLAQVTSYVGSKPVAVVVKGQPPLRGILELKTPGAWQVTANGKAETFDAAKVDLIMPEDTYQKLMVETPKPWQAWHGAAGLGYSIQHGDQQTSTLTTNINAVHERPETPIFQPHWRTAYNFTTLLSHASETTATVTSRTLTTNLRADYLFTDKNFVFGFGQLDHISTEGLYLRQTVGGGFGRDLIKNDRTIFSALGGLTYTHEHFKGGLHDQSAEVLVGEKLGLQLSKRAHFDHYLNFYPNLSHSGWYRFDTSAVLSCKLNNRFSVNLSAIDLYLSNPPPHNQSNNITLSVGLGYTF
jgi:putative salt-induced outer membrane protein YdiY